MESLLLWFLECLYITCISIYVMIKNENPFGLLLFIIPFLTLLVLKPFHEKSKDKVIIKKSLTVNGRTLTEGDYVKHFKYETITGDEKTQNRYIYKIIAIQAHHSETSESLVVYEAQYGNCNIYVRPLDMFFAEVNHEKYKNISQKYRFELIEPSTYHLYGIN